MTRDPTAQPILFKPGKKAKTKDARDLKWRDYIDRTQLPQIPQPPFGHVDLVQLWGMLGNDSLGDCVIAGHCHDVMLDNAEAGRVVTFTDKNAIDAYGAACGYNPDDPSSDQGCQIRDALKFFRTQGITDSAGIVHKIDAFVTLDQTDIREIYESVFLFGKAKIGLQLPRSAVDQFNAGQPWTVVDGSPIEGGHDVEIVNVLANGDLEVVTWGQTQTMTLGFFNKFADEAWAILSKEMLTSKGISLEGFNFDQLMSDINDMHSIPPAPQPKPQTPTHLAVSPAVIFESGYVALRADLVDTRDTIPVKGANVTFSIDGLMVGAAVTNEEGFAMIPYSTPTEAGIHRISAVYAGGDIYASASGGNFLIVLPWAAYQAKTLAQEQVQKSPMTIIGAMNNLSLAQRAVQESEIELALVKDGIDPGKVPMREFDMLRRLVQSLATVGIKADEAVSSINADAQAQTASINQELQELSASIKARQDAEKGKA